MANSVAIQTLADNRENVILKMVGYIDTADVGSTVLVDPATLNDMGPFPGQKATALRIKRIEHNIEDTLAVRFYWDASVPLLIGEYAGRHEYDAMKYGGMQNNAGAGKTGKILYDTLGWAASAKLTFTIILHLGKQ